jgi:Transglutaminase-like superfamily
MKPNIAFLRICWYAVHALLVLSFVVLLWGLGWEASMRSYLHGFSNAVVPAAATPEQRVQAILDWMSHGPARRIASDPDSIPTRDPEETLNYRQLLDVCGTATNAFVNLAWASGLGARRLLLLTPERQVKHVVAEVRLNGRWVVVDPTYRILFRDAQGDFLSKEQLRNPGIWREATGAVPGYPPSYTYEITSRVHLYGLPVIGRWLRPLANRIFPSWEDDIDWTLVLERESFAVIVVAGLVLFCCLGLRFLLSWYGDRRFGKWRPSLREQLRQAGAALVASTK